MDDGLEPENRKTNIFAILSVIFAFLMPLFGLIFGVISLSQIDKKGQRGKTLAIIGMVISATTLLVSIFFVLPFLAYFGVLDPARMLPERCELSPGLNCADRAAVTQDSITLVLRNNVGYPIMLKSATTGKCSDEVKIFNEGISIPIEGAEIPAYEGFNIMFTGCSFSGDKVSEDFMIVFENQETGLETTARGSVASQIQ